MRFSRYGAQSKTNCDVCLHTGACFVFRLYSVPARDRANFVREVHRGALFYYEHLAIFDRLRAMHAEPLMSTCANLVVRQCVPARDRTNSVREVHRKARLFVFSCRSPGNWA